MLKKYTLINPVRVVFVLAVIALGSCEAPVEEDETLRREFLIRAGEHYATPRLLETVSSSNLKFRATFDESASYTLDDPSMQANMNKLMGFSDCGNLHHENSARFAWAWLDNQLKIYAYCYVDSIRVHTFVGTVNLNEENLYEIRIEGDSYVFYLNGERKAEVTRKPECEDGIKYMLYPYFGGSVPAPHDVRVKIVMAG